MINYLKSFVIFILIATLCSCASTKMQSQLNQGERLFNQGYYKRSLTELLPLAVEGNAKAQYAVGYKYYYGYGVTQDTDTGYFWINRAANQNYAPAIVALSVIAKNPKFPPVR